ncbi:TPA: hypothetical protein SLU47_000150 [Pseudomonas aeruginosa]|nr:hypothetical protein [Pseudomonas aeruginosa]HEJ5392607.1 hypothetical protein [Pseudomonas aeruginosa]
MTRLELFSEPFAKTGNIAADGFKRLLGSPAQDLLQTVLRESIQNSIDAARMGHGPSLQIRLRTLTAEQCSALKDQVLGDLPQDDQTRADIVAAIDKQDLKVLEICDFNSTGLGGPTSGDVASDGKEALDFVNFLRNVGVARDTHHGGGTYGYGKTSLYAMSACSTILVDSQTTCEGQPVRRFMGCHLGSAFDGDAGDGKRKRFTGRHWWGVSDGEGGIDPLTDASAAAIAASLGMPERDVNNTGTSIMILAPHLEEGDEARPVDHYIQETILWNFWPKLTTSTPEAKKLNIRVEIEGNEVPLPTPEEFPPLDLFAAAMAAYREDRSVEIIRSERPKKTLGKLTTAKGLCAARSGAALDELTIMPKPARHIALMRPVELIVKYMEGNPFPDSRFEWAGVFVCSDEKDVESAFALSEPPAHDDWIPDNLPDRNAKTYVRVALKRIESFASNYATPVLQPNTSTGERGPSLASTATRLGRLLDSVSGKGPGKPKPPPRSPSKRNELSISPARFIRLKIDELGQRCAVFEADLQNDEADDSLDLFAESHLIADGAKADAGDLPSGYETRVIEMSLVDSGETITDSTLRVGTQSGTVRVSVLSPPEAAVGVRLQFLNGDNQ